jgi:hypothetical protein
MLGAGAASISVSVQETQLLRMGNWSLALAVSTQATRAALPAARAFSSATLQ